jgi:glycosidase
MRHTNSALLEGRYIALNENDPNVLAYARSYREETVLVVLNMSGVVQKVHLDLASKGLRGKTAKTLLTSFSAPIQVDSGEISVEPFGAWVGETE